MSIKKIWGSRVHSTGSTYIAETGIIFYDETDGELRLGNGVTPGGVAISVRADLIVAQRLTPALDNNNAYGLGDETHRWWDAHIGDGGVHYNGFVDPQTVPYIPGVQVEDIIPAVDNGVNLGDTDKRFANIYLGYDGLFLADQTTDANINITVDDGTLYVDGAANLAIGNLIIENTTLKSFTTDLDINIGEANDTGFFYVRRKAQFDNTTFGSTQPMVSFNASGGAEPATVFPDTILQTVSRPNKNSRVVQRSYGSLGNVGGDNAYAVWASYAARGNTASPAALKQNDILARVSANGFGTTTWGSGGARMEFVALENFTDSAKGTRINFWTTPQGQIASQNVASINSVGVIAAGIEFSGDSTVQTTAGIPLSAKAVSSATYVATLGIDGKLDATQIPSALTGAIVFKGVWNATTNTPALSDTTPAGLSTGWEYIVETGGTRDIGDGSKTFAAGDFVIYDGTHWKQVPSGNTFISLTGGGGITVNQSTGAMVLGSTATPLSTTATIVSRDSSGNFAANVITANLTGAVTGSVSGNAGSVTNGVYTNGSYANPAWITSLAASKVGLGNVENTALSTSTHYIGTTNITYNRASASQTLTGVSIDGNAGSVTNGVYTTGSQSIDGIKTFTSTIQGTITSATLAASVVGGIGVATLTAGTGTAVSANSGTVTVWNTIPAFNTGTLVANAVTAVSATTAKSATTATNLAVATSLFAGKLSAATGSISKNSVATVTYTITGLTTNHKIIITPGTVMPDRQFSVTAAWASAADTVSIQYANNSGGAVSVTLDINYFAFV